MFKIKDEYKLELQTPEIIKLFGDTKILLVKMKNGEYVESLELAEVILVSCNLVDTQYNESLKYYTLLRITNLMLIC